MHGNKCGPLRNGSLILSHFNHSWNIQKNEIKIPLNTKFGGNCFRDPPVAIRGLGVKMSMAKQN
jgi:hypothetical protein